MRVQFGDIRLSQLQARLQDGPVTLVDQRGHQISKRVPGSGQPSERQWLPTQFAVAQVVQADMRYPDEAGMVDWPFVLLNYKENNGELGVTVNTQKARRLPDGDYLFRHLDFKA